MVDNSERILDWVPRKDPESKNYPVRGAAAPPKLRSRFWTPGKVIDQGYEGACVGFGWTAEALATPVRVNLLRVKAEIPRTEEAFARFVYRSAQKIDEWAGENYEGTSVLAGAKVLKSLGLLREYRWAFSVSDVLLGLNRGPVVLGIEWRQGMYEAPGGVLRVVGDVVGGHCITAVGYSISAPELGGEPGVLLQNSWGESWGNGGFAYISLPDLNTLLRRDGEACVPWSRSYGR